MYWRPKFPVELDSNPRVAESTWLSVFALGLIVPALPAVEFFRTRPLATPATLSLRPDRGRADGVVDE
jgi:hypothetical protein